jgi:hypothetical protein
MLESLGLLLFRTNSTSLWGHWSGYEYALDPASIVFVDRELGTRKINFKKSYL